MKNLWQLITDTAINVRVGEYNELDAAEKIMNECRRLLQEKGRIAPPKVEEDEYPVLLGVTHVMKICNCSKSSAYEIMRQPHRPQWREGKKLRLSRDLFFAQLEEESRQGMRKALGA